MKKILFVFIVLFSPQFIFASYTEHEQASTERCEYLESETEDIKYDIETRSDKVKRFKTSVSRLERELKADAGSIENNISDCEDRGEGCSFVNEKIDRYNDKRSEYVKLIRRLNNLVDDSNDIINNKKPLFTEYQNQCVVYRYLNRISPQ